MERLSLIIDFLHLIYVIRHLIHVSKHHNHLIVHSDQLVNFPFNNWLMNGMLLCICRDES